MHPSDAFDESLAGSPLDASLFELPDPQVFARVAPERQAGLRVGDERRGAPIAIYAWEEDSETFELSEVPCPRLFALLAGLEEEEEGALV